MAKTSASTPSRKARPSAVRPAETQAAINRPDALRLRIQGLSYRAIGEQLKVSHTVARQYVEAEMERANTTPEERNHLREMERARLETILVRMMTLAARADIIIRTEKDGARGPVTITVEDYLSATKAADTVVKISARIASLYGLDAPVKQEHSGSVSIEGIAAIRARLEARKSA